MHRTHDVLGQYDLVLFVIKESSSLLRPARRKGEKKGSGKMVPVTFRIELANAMRTYSSGSFSL
jgi:hypothetical protein